MRVFVTGASGWLGSALVPDLIGADHEVTGLARSDASAAALTEAGVRVHRGDLDDPGGLRGAAGASDGVIHLAFNVDMVRSGDFQGAVDADQRPVAALGAALTGSEPPAGGRRAVAVGGAPTRAAGGVRGRPLGAPVVPAPADEASEHFGFLAGFLAADNPVSSTLTRELLGWQPTHPGLIEDLDKGHYFHSRSA